MRAIVVALIVGSAGLSGFAGAGCSRKANQENTSEKAVAANPEFDQKWSALAKEDVDVFYIEDDRAEGLMGNVRRARGATDVPANKGSDSPMPPAKLSHEDAQRVIKQNLAGVRACFMRLGHGGDQRSGKAIVSFEIGPAGDVKDTKVDAPAFQGTSLPGCVMGMVSHWVFPKSQKGGLAISYPFVFVGG
jgi:hypothetical protein